MTRLTATAFVGILIANLASGCTPGSPDAALVNADTRSFTSSWKRTSSMGGTETITLKVKNQKFRINENIIYDGATLYLVNTADNRVDCIESPSFREIPFWKMASRVSPFPAPTEVRKEKLLGRDVRVLQAAGQRDGAPITLTYWIGQETNILLKKAHIIGLPEDPIFSETYECVSVELESLLDDSLFEFQIPPDYVKVKAHILPTDWLRTNF